MDSGRPVHLFTLFAAASVFLFISPLLAGCRRRRLILMLTRRGIMITPTGQLSDHHYRFHWPPTPPKPRLMLSGARSLLTIVLLALPAASLAQNLHDSARFFSLLFVFVVSFHFYALRVLLQGDHFFNKLFSCLSSQRLSVQQRQRHRIASLRMGARRERKSSLLANHEDDADTKGLNWRCVWANNASQEFK